MTLMPKLRLNHLTCAYPVPESDLDLPVLRDVSFDVKEKELLCLVGPSGCGKTTLLRVLAGLVKPTEGSLEVDGTFIHAPGPQRILLFQDLHLFHWLTVLKNVEFAYEARSIDKSQRSTRARNILQLVGLDGFEQYYPQEISGGMRQRLGLARALAAEPTVLLMDEPFQSLDVYARGALESEFLNLREATGVTTILVTHDVRQAVFLGDRILVMSSRPGTIKETFVVPFSRPRNESMRRSVEFHKLEDAISSSITSEGNSI